MEVTLNTLLSRSAELEANLTELLALRPCDDSERALSSRVMCSIAFEHAESAKILIASGNFTSATGLVRLQYEALVRAMWILYTASDNDITKLMCDLTSESAARGNKIPLLSEMLDNLSGKAPAEALRMLLEFKQYSWRPLSSFVHGGIHAIHRHGKGYPPKLLYQTLKISNGVSIMVGMLLVILHGGGEMRGKMPQIQMEFADCFIDLKVT
ncbi:MAG: hypothetical protein AW11_01882 [Candidatus Accumulibacter regalis]|uniref:Uncharacterized protein n=1 Tax=Accumulibacter regalis TaxID=522306 RepID=A0A011PNC1_ACCRE|nr:hypothetical protein [Accumulibacter sp.]EXI88946.1 MAG: hypothetical protein AW11_01882 [Candidatus Accumulibacter regalis]HRE72678.1 hypothetical protein [Accumulibacter sp.]